MSYDPEHELGRLVERSAPTPTRELPFERVLRRGTRLRRVRRLRRVATTAVVVAGLVAGGALLERGGVPEDVDIIAGPNPPAGPAASPWVRVAAGDELALDQRTLGSLSSVAGQTITGAWPEDVAERVRALLDVDRPVTPTVAMHGSTAMIGGSAGLVVADADGARLVDSELVEVVDLLAVPSGFVAIGRSSAQEATVARFGPTGGQEASARLEPWPGGSGGRLRVTTVDGRPQVFVVTTGEGTADQSDVRAAVTTASGELVSQLEWEQVPRPAEPWSFDSDVGPPANVSIRVELPSGRASVVLDPGSHRVLVVPPGDATDGGSSARARIVTIRGADEPLPSPDTSGATVAIVASDDALFAGRLAPTDPGPTPSESYGALTPDGHAWHLTLTDSTYTLTGLTPPPG